MYYRLNTKATFSTPEEYYGERISLSRAIRDAEEFLASNNSAEVLVYQVSEENLDDIDSEELEKWHSEEIRDRERCIRHFVWDGGIQDA